jgi:dTDP-4-dehydrorhamnose 3,5-epimerase-like enzyme
VRFDDPAIGIAWPLPVGTVSDRDGSFARLADGFEGLAI